MGKILPPSKDKKFWGEDSDSILIHKPEQIFGVAKEGHRWIQQGPYLVCKSCILKHSLYIGMEKRLVGFNEDGTPRLEKY